MKELTAWNKAGGKGILLYDSYTMLHELLLNIDAINSGTNKRIINFIGTSDEHVANLSNTYLNVNCMTGVSVTQNINNFILVVINPNEISDFYMELILNIGTKYILMLSDKYVTSKSINSRYKVIDVVNSGVVNYSVNFVEPKEKVARYLKKIDDKLEELIAIFGDYDNVIGCARGANGINAREFRSTFAESKGWSRDIDTSIPMLADIASIYNPEALYENATMYDSLSKDRNRILSHNEDLVNRVVDVCKTHEGKRILIIGKNGKICDDICDTLHSNYRLDCKSLHIDMRKEPMLETRKNSTDYVRYKSGDNEGEIKQFGSTSLIKHYTNIFNNKGKTKILAITGAIPKDCAIKNVDLVIITSLKCLSFIEAKNRLKHLNSDNVLYVLTKTDKQVSNFKFTADKYQLNAKIIDDFNDFSIK